MRTGKFSMNSVRHIPITVVMILTCMGLGACPAGNDQLPQQVVAQLVQQGYLKASNTGSGDRFGVKVALDGETVAVGATFEASAAMGVNGNQSDNSAFGSGAVYVFTKVNGIWVQQAYLKASNSEAGDLFGVGIALSGDTLVVGAPGEASSATGANGNQADNTASHSGAVYVFTRSAGVWSQQTYLKASNTDPGDQFGVAVALNGDTLAVGSNLEDSNAVGVDGLASDNSALESGAVYVFTRSGGAWSQQAYLKASNTDPGDRFGSSLAIKGDTLVVGASTESSNATGVNGNQLDNSASQSGAAYVFERTGGGWSQQAYLKASNTGGGDQFGVSVALTADTLAVGAWYEDSVVTVLTGAVYIFTQTAGIWSQQAYIKPDNADHDDQFGVALGLDGDTLAVGAWGEDGGATGVNGNPHDNSAMESGAVYTFRRSGVTWGQDSYVKASNAAAGDQFGWGLGLGAGVLVVGAPFEASAATGFNGDQADNSAAQSGAAYVFQLH